MLEDDFLQTFQEAYPHALTERYELLECLGVGEQRETFLAREKETSNLCVVKCYTEQGMSMGRNEAAILKKLSNPFIVPYLDCIETESMFCVIREYVEGITLEERRRRGKLPVTEIITIGIMLCDGLTYLHQQTPPVIHRDIKPQNIILREDGSVVLIDFEIARSYQDNREQDTIIIGTRHYAAPEQYGFSQTDCRTDLFSLGMVLLFLMTDSTKTEPDSLPDGPVKKAIIGCTKFSPKERFRTAQEVAAVLKNRLSMRKWGCIAVFICMIALFILAGGYSRNDSFQEPLIEKAALVALGKSPKDKLTEEDCLAVTSLWILADECYPDADSFYDNFSTWGEAGAVHSRLADISDLQRFPNLTELGIYGGRIADLSPLIHLTNLTYVNLGENYIVDCSELGLLENLQTLLLFHNPIQDISALTQLSALTELELGQCDVTNFIPLLELPNLQSVTISEDMSSFMEMIEDKARFQINVF